MILRRVVKRRSKLRLKSRRGGELRGRAGQSTDELGV